MTMNILLIAFMMKCLTDYSPEKPVISEWRGPERNGIYTEKNLLKAWPAEGPKEILTIENIGNGYGSPVFVGNLLYITGEIDTVAYIFCYNLKGEKQWQTALGKEWIKSCRGSRSAPTVADDLVYTGTGFGNLFCLDRFTGRIRWSAELAADFNGILPLHGHSESPLVFSDKVFWTAGGKAHNVVALNRFTGKIIWSNKGFGETSAYNQPKLVMHPSGNILVTFSSYHLMGFDVETGKMLWSHEQTSYPVNERQPGNGDTHCNTVIFENGSIWYQAGDGNGGVRLDISPDGSGIKEVWRNKNFDGFMGGVVKTGDFIYGSGTLRPQLISVNAGNGNIRDSLRVGSGALIAADDMLYYYTQKGEMMLISYSEGKLEKISSFRIRKGTKEHFSHPVMYKGVLYQRHGNILMGFDIRKKV